MRTDDNIESKGLTTTNFCKSVAIVLHGYVGKLSVFPFVHKIITEKYRKNSLHFERPQI